MIRLLTLILGRLPIGYFQLTHSRGRFMAALAGVAFANVLVFVQLGIQGSMSTTSVKPYSFFGADVIIAPSDARTFSDGGNVARQRMLQALAVPGVADAMALYIGIVDWSAADGQSSSLEVYGIDPGKGHFLEAEFKGMSDSLTLADSAIVDHAARGLILSEEDIARMPGQRFEFKGRELTVVDTVSVGGGFTSDGAMLVSDQTFFHLFPNRASSAPDRIFLKTESSSAPETVAARVTEAISTDTVKVNTKTAAIQADLDYQTSERPTGIIFGFGVLMGVLVGVVIVYQVLSTDVSNHLKEYATFKAIGYPHKFFLGIVLEQAVILAVAGFIPGVIISTGMYVFLSQVTGLPVSMDAGRAMFVLLGTLTACFLSGALATRKLAAAEPADLF